MYVLNSYIDSLQDVIYILEMQILLELRDLAMNIMELLPKPPQIMIFSDTCHLCGSEPTISKCVMGTQWQILRHTTHWDVESVPLFRYISNIFVCVFLVVDVLCATHLNKFYDNDNFIIYIYMYKYLE